MIKEKINEAILYMKRNRGCGITYAFLTEEDFKELQSLDDGEFSYERESIDGGYMLWSIACYPFKSLAFVDDVVKNGPLSASGAMKLYREKYEDMILVSVEKSVDVVRDQVVSEELYNRNYVLTDEIQGDDELFNKVGETLTKFTHPFLTLEVSRRNFRFFKIKFIGKFQYKEYIDEYRFFILNFLNRIYNLNVYGSVNDFVRAVEIQKSF